MDESIIILKSVWEEIVDTIGEIAPEAGGIIGERDNRIVSYYFDVDGISLDNQYIPNVKEINRVIESWSFQNIVFSGFIHSHPENKEKLSYADIMYFARLIKHNDMERMNALILLQRPEIHLCCYVLTSEGILQNMNYIIEK